jgi:phosphopantetheinyl transferase
MDFISFQTPVKRTGTVIWYASIQDRALTSNEYFQHVVSQLSVPEQSNVKRFIFEPDQKRGLLSILLQRALIHKEFDFANKYDFEIRKTKENKPYLVSTKKHIGHWNYNVSHHGDFVCIAADHDSLVSESLL